jgi:hypothetical protein
MRLFAKAETVARWQDDLEVVSARERVDALSQSCQAAHDELKALQQRGGDDKVERLVTVPNPASPMWPKLQNYQQLSAALKDAQRDLAAAERSAKSRSAQAGYDLAFETWTEHVVPAVRNLIVALERLERLRPEIAERTSAQIGALGHVTLTPAALTELLDGVPRRGVFGQR